ncbi:hypothetical protein F0919_02660 [Taibaiella lutea]|uniref:Uncharacterized protein n=1 Tax=Taibaiella lutea TaxID=2608001 RepID=A0A5M6CTU3_9BACT|nr:hypothetical protein [Taibaiella lutea]KAA5536589.1 hypothetical protein F0919_02660 [Taibaiella lutea]
MSEEPNAEVKFLFNRYEQALRNSIADDALKFGQLYFNALRHGEMTDADKEQLQNDILLCCVNKKIE